MIEPQSAGVEKFNNTVGLKFQLYNSLFLSLPFYGIDKTGILLSLFSKECDDGYEASRDPVSIVENFLADKGPEETVDLLLNSCSMLSAKWFFLMLLEDSAFRELNDMRGPGQSAILRPLRSRRASWTSF